MLGRRLSNAFFPAGVRVCQSNGVTRVFGATDGLREAGERVNHKRIARVMRGAGLAGVRLRRRHRTTVADPAAVKAPDLIGRDFTASEPNTKYVGDGCGSREKNRRGPRGRSPVESGACRVRVAGRGPWP